MKTTLLIMVIALMNIYPAAEKARHGNFGGLAATGLVSGETNLRGRMKPDADTSVYRPSLEQLKDAGTGRLDISFSSSGCFRQYSRKLTFRKTTEGITVSLYETKPNADGQFPEGSLLASKLVTTDDWKAWADFETGLYTARDGGCTTTERYVISDENGTANITDGSCSWFGFNKLMIGFFGKADPSATAVR